MQFRNLSRSAVLLLACSFPIAVRSQQTDPVPVTVNVTDPSGAAIPNARIELSPLPSPDQTELTADANGRLNLNLRSGGYCAAFSSPGFKVLQGHIDVRGPVTIPVKLTIGSCTECVEVVPADGNFLIVFTLPYRQAILTPADMSAMKHISVIVRNAYTKAVERYSGVPLIDLINRLEQTGGPKGKDLRVKPSATYVVATGVGGSKAVLARAETDPELHPANVVVADALDGKPLAAKDGPFELVIGNDRNPDRSVRKLVSIELKTAE